MQANGELSIQMRSNGLPTASNRQKNLLTPIDFEAALANVIC
jgi:hypothetical protein